MSAATKRLSSEMKAMSKVDESEGFTASPLEDGNLMVWKARIRGPPDTVYEGGYYHMRFDFPPDYPFSPPKVKFLNKIWHTNISNGNICIDILNVLKDQQTWSPCFKTHHVLLSIMALLQDPNPAHPFDPAQAKEFTNNRGEFDKKAREWVKLYASDPNPPSTIKLAWSTAALPEP